MQTHLPNRETVRDGRTELTHAILLFRFFMHFAFTAPGHRHSLNNNQILNGAVELAKGLKRVPQLKTLKSVAFAALNIAIVQMLTDATLGIVPVKYSNDIH